MEAIFLFFIAIAKHSDIFTSHMQLYWWAQPSIFFEDPAEGQLIKAHSSHKLPTGADALNLPYVQAGVHLGGRGTFAPTCVNLVTPPPPLKLPN